MIIIVGKEPGLIPELQDAVDVDVEFKCVKVAPGIYEEDVLIEKPVEISGESIFSIIEGDLDIDIRERIQSKYTMVLDNLDLRGTVRVRNLGKRGRLLIRGCIFNPKKVLVSKGIRVDVERYSRSRMKLGTL